MKKITLTGIIFTAFFIALPSVVFATAHCSTPPGGTTPVCIDNILSFEAVTWESSFAKTVGESQLFVEINNAAGGKIEFHFYNTGPVASSITDIYFGDNIPIFDYGPDMGNAIIDNDGQPGVNFSDHASPAGMPGGVPFPAVMFSADSDSPVSQNGINPGEYLNIILGFESGAGYNDLINALADGSMSLGLHVQAIGTKDRSIKMTSIACILPGGGPGPGPTPIPEPTTMFLLGTGLAGIAGMTRKRKKTLK